jgi:hypothetical protein
MSDRLCDCQLKPDCPVHGEDAQREANATSMNEFLPEIAVAELDSGTYVIVQESNVESVMQRISNKGGGLVACYRLASVQRVVKQPRN